MTVIGDPRDTFYTGITSTAGTKDDDLKDRWDLLPVRALREVVHVLMHGLKYGAYNWAEGLEYHRPYGAIQRHATAFWEGEDKDPDSGLHHLAHLICEALFLLHYELTGGYRRFDDRPFKE